MKLSVIIVSYNAVSFLDKCLFSIEQNKTSDMEVIVWDNNSTDRSIEQLECRYPKVKFNFSSENQGFSTGNNRAVEIAQGEYVLILNPDTEVSADFFDKILGFADSKEKPGAIGVRMVDGNSDFLPESKRNLPSFSNSFYKVFKFNSKNNIGYYADHIDEFSISEVEVLSGACMLLKRKVYLQVGGFDERYFMYGEDIDLSYTLLQNGFINYYVGNITLLHHKGESTIKDRKYLDRFYGAMELFLTKYEKPRNSFTYYLALSGVKLKYNLEKIKLRFK